ncbi:predicted protein [Plenodomus lingam JN3]|uniref:Uncharacterized protein n=1 Tax=Leptosphaeria maculans (strain JN3 / isolate v23.1.3 / race Av1-4-5-6-7-8) TaxID=985895 RepID=E4ZGZ7_LEPMJ|nr:predicted protein [Plenodomus lingam JN3]CBX90567.1 predicted protein [Plenodomus lingam JN3]
MISISRCNGSLPIGTDTARLQATLEYHQLEDENETITAQAPDEIAPPSVNFWSRTATLGLSAPII